MQQEYLDKLKIQWYEHVLCMDGPRISFERIGNEDNK